MKNKTREQLEKFKGSKFAVFLKFFGIFLAVVVLFNIYNAVFSNTNNGSYNSNNLKLERDITTGGARGTLSMPSMGMDKVSNDAVDSQSPRELQMMSEKSTLAVGDSRTTLATEKKEIKNGFLTLKVESTDDATNKISEIIAKNEGEIFSSNFNEYKRGSRSGTITIKVPVVNFQKTIVELKTVATQVINESTSGRDVTEQYVDLQAQLRNKKLEEQTFVSLLDRAGELDDVLNVSREIARVRGDIERLAGKIKYLESQTDMSTITVSVSEDVEVTSISDDWRPAQVVKQALNDLKTVSQDFVDATIHFFIVTIPSFVPFVIFLAVIYWIGKKIYRAISGK